MTMDALMRSEAACYQSGAGGALPPKEDGKLSFVMYDNWQAQLLKLDLTQRGILLTNIYARRNGEGLLEMDAVTDMLFSIICDQLDRDNAKWELKRERRRAAGAAGGRASAQARRAAAEGEANATFATGGEANEADNEYGNGNAIAKVNASATVSDNGTKAPAAAGQGAALQTPAVAAVMRVYMDRINPTPSRLCIDQLADFAQTLGAEVCVHAMDVALDEKKTAWSYIRGILRGYQADGVRCLADIKTREKKREIAKTGAKNGGFQLHGGALSERARKAVREALAEQEEEESHEALCV